MKTKNDFGVGSVSKNILSLAIPMTIAQLINILYSVVDRMYIGRIPGASTLALTGVGLTLPIITIIMAFANLFGMGGAPLCSIERGKGNNEMAEKIMGISYTLLLISGVILTVLILIFKNKLLYLFGASSNTFQYADNYITIYLTGTIFVMISLGMNNFINSQGFGKKGMMTILIGAVLNIILDPIFIFILKLGVKGAAAATVISQASSALYVLKFLHSKESILKLKIAPIDFSLFKQITFLGLSGFIMAVTNSSVQIAANVTLNAYGGDLYVGIMTVLNSVREIIVMPVSGLTNGSQPILGFNYGAKKYDRVQSGIKFMSLVCIGYSLMIWLVLRIFPSFFIKIFNNNSNLIANGIPSLHLYFSGFFMMALQFAGQSTFVALGKSKHAIFFSILRKIIIVVPLTIILPTINNLGCKGVFLAEPISNYAGGTLCYVTMLFSVFFVLKKKTE